jgi:hypothetical protein
MRQAGHATIEGVAAYMLTKSASQRFPSSELVIFCTLQAGKQWFAQVLQHRRPELVGNAPRRLLLDAAGDGA